MKTSKYIFLFEIALIICWSSGFIGAKLASNTSFVFLVLFWRFAFTSVVLLPFILIFIRKKEYWKSIGFQILIGTFAMFGYLVFGVKAVDFGVPLGTGALIFSLQPLVVAGAASIFLSEIICARQWLGFSISFLGIVIAIQGSLGEAPLWAFSFPFFGMISIVIGTILAKKIQETKKYLELPILPTLWAQSFISAILFAPFVYHYEEFKLPTEPALIYPIVWFVLFSTIGAYGFYWICLKFRTASRVSGLIYLTSPVTAIWAWVMFDESMTVFSIIGFTICIAGVIIASWGIGLMSIHKRMGKN